MTVAEILKSVKFVVSPGGKKSAVMLEMGVWKNILEMLENVEDADELNQAHTIQEETIPWQTAKKELGLGE